MNAITELFKHNNRFNFNPDDIRPEYTTMEKPVPTKPAMKLSELFFGTEATPTEGKKSDSDKPDYALLTRPMVESMIAAFMYGERKYSRGNFKGGFANVRLLAAAMRHIMAFNDGEDLDPESGVSHLGHAQAALAMLLDNRANDTSVDGRYSKV